MRCGLQLLNTTERLSGGQSGMRPPGPYQAPAFSPSFRSACFISCIHDILLAQLRAVPRPADAQALALRLALLRGVERPLASLTQMKRSASDAAAGSGDEAAAASGRWWRSGGSAPQAVELDSEGKARRLRLLSCAAPHMRSFHLAWLSHFVAVFGEHGGAFSRLCVCRMLCELVAAACIPAHITPAEPSCTHLPPAQPRLPPPRCCPSSATTWTLIRRRYLLLASRQWLARSVSTAAALAAAADPAGAASSCCQTSASCSFASA